jgi:acyl carrier protein
MSLDPEIRRQLAARRQIYGLTFEEGLEALCRALASGLPRVVVSTRDFATVRARRHSIAVVLDGLERFRREAAGRHPRPVLGTPYVAPRTELERSLAGIWQELLGIEEVGIEDNFLEMGGHSLLALQAIARVHETLGLDLPLHTLLATPTVRELAAALAELPAAAGLAPDVGEGALWEPARTLDDLGELSDDQVDGLLAEILAERGEERV